MYHMKDRYTKAYPTPEHAQESGMFLRDYFAGQALGAFLNNFQSGDVAAVALRLSPESVAEYCYAIADAMTSERTKG